MKNLPNSKKTEKEKSKGITNEKNLLSLKIIEKKNQAIIIVIWWNNAGKKPSNFIK